MARASVGWSWTEPESRGRGVVGRGWVLRGVKVVKEFRSACLSPGHSSAASWRPEPGRG